MDMTIAPEAAGMSEVRLLSPHEADAARSDDSITADDHKTYGNLGILASGHQSHRQIAARIVWLSRDSLDFMPVIYAARDRIMHLACRVDELETHARSSWIRVEDRLPVVGGNGDSEEVLAYFADGTQRTTRVGYVNGEVEWLAGGWTPTHWQPKLPAPEKV